MEDKEQEVTTKKRKERTELPEGYEWRNGCKSCKHYKEFLESGFFLPLNFETNLCEPPGPPAPERQKLGIRIDFWVRHRKTGKIEIVDKKWYEENKKKWDLEHIKMTSCRLRRIYEHIVIDEVTGKEFKKLYCAYWEKA